MAVYNKIDIFVENLTAKIMDLFGTGAGADTLKLMLVNSPAPVATNQVKADLTEIAAGNGYTAGGQDATLNGTRSTGTYTATGTKVVWTASGGTIGPFRYVVLYDDTVASPVKPLIAWWDYGTNLTLNNGETFSAKFNGSDTTGTIFTIV